MRLYITFTITVHSLFYPDYSFVDCIAMAARIQQWPRERTALIGADWFDSEFHPNSFELVGKKVRN